MGLCLGVVSPIYSYDDLKAELGQAMFRFPLAELQVGGIIKLEGMMGFFSTKPLLVPKWLKDRMTMQEYQWIIEAVNEGTINAMVGLPKMFTPSDIPARAMTAAGGAQAAVDNLNLQWNSKNVFITFAMGEQHTNIVDIRNHGAGHHKHQSVTTQHKQDTFLYIRID